MSLNIEMLIQQMVKKEASDLHVSVGMPPALRINGSIYKLKTDPLSAEDTKNLCYSLLTDEQKREFEAKKELDFSFGVKKLARLRANLFVQRGTVAGVFRRIYREIPVLEDLGFPEHIKDLINRPFGLVLVTGATGSGKSTTLAAFLEELNRSRRSHVITIEEPIEYTFKHNKCVINQREVGADCESFSTALGQALREDPDVICVGEMRDEATAEMALRAAETGHLVFSTVHTNGAISSVNRLVQMFPQDRQQYIRTLLSFSLEAVVSQALCERSDKKGRVLAYEYLTMTPAIRHLIRDGKMHQVYSQMQIGQDQHGMRVLNQSLLELVKKGIIDEETAQIHSPDVEDLRKYVRESRIRKAV